MELIKETTIEGEFKGYDRDKIFTFPNGEKWQQAVYKYRYVYKYRPKVKLWKDGSKYYLEFDCINETIQVRKFMG